MHLAKGRISRYESLVSRKIPLPIDDAMQRIVELTREHLSLVLTAAPGAGKTTRVPPALLSAFPNGEIWMLEPRRLAARAAAARIADENGWALGEEVGYQVRFESRVGPRTRIRVITEALLARRLATDPELRGVAAVILDEFHERSWHTDLALGFLYELQQTSRPDLAIVVMSATIDSRLVSAFLGDAPTVDVPGRAHPVEIEWSAQSQLLQTGNEFTGRVASLARALMQGEKPRDGDVLAFLPGAGEIAAIERATRETARARGWDVLPLHGNLSLENQARALARGPRPKLILSTNVAETSVTVDGVACVIDCGLARVLRQEPYGFPELELERISRFSAVQRAGRAGRQGPGRCYRLWSRLDELSMSESLTPEILRADLSEATLALAAFGVSKPEGFSWIEAPSRDRLEAAQANLRALGALDLTTGAITDEGRALLKIPLEPRLAKLALEGARRGSARLAAGLAASLSEKDLLRDARDAKRVPSGESDPLARAWLLDGSENAAEVDRGALMRARKARDQIVDSVRPFARPGARFDEETEAKQLLLIAFSDRLARRRTLAKGDGARLVGGVGATLSPHSACERAELFVCARASGRELGAARRAELVVDWASAVEKEWIVSLFPQRVRKQVWTAWDDDGNQALSYSALCFDDLPLEEANARKPSPEDAEPLMIAAILRKWDSLIARDAEAARWQGRLAFARSARLGSETWPEFDDAFKAQIARELARGETRLAAIEAKPWSGPISECLPWNLRAALDRDAPSRFTAPSGSSVAIEYPLDQAPFIEIRLQEMFGLADSPRIAGGRTPLQLRLLGPNYRPVQVTQDLGSFWKNGYPEVRRELRSRYPKHSWPDDPLSARPEAKGRRTTR